MGPQGHAALEVTLRCIGASFYIIFEAEGMVLEHKDQASRVSLLPKTALVLKVAVKTVDSTPPS